MMLLRDLGELFDQPFMTEEFCYRWSADQPYANNAFLRLRQGSETAQDLLARAAEVGAHAGRRRFFGSTTARYPA